MEEKLIGIKSNHEIRYTLHRKSFSYEYFVNYVYVCLCDCVGVGVRACVK